MSALGRLAKSDVADLLERVRLAPMWASPVSSDPFGTSEPLTAEIASPTLRRVQLVWGTDGHGLLRNSNAGTFANLPARSRIAGVAGWSAVYNGTLRAYWPLPDGPRDLLTGGAWSFPAGELGIGLDVGTAPVFAGVSTVTYNEALLELAAAQAKVSALAGALAPLAAAARQAEGYAAGLRPEVAARFAEAIAGIADDTLVGKMILEARTTDSQLATLIVKLHHLPELVAGYQR